VDKAKVDKTRARAKTTFSARPQHGEDSRSAAYAQRMRELLDGRAPPDVSQPSGILAFQVHQLAELECKDLPHAEKSSKKHAKVPSSYCTVMLNDEKVYQTRIKPVSEIHCCKYSLLQVEGRG